WTAKADPQNRTLGVNLALDPSTGRIIKRENFDQRQWIDRAVEIGVAAHEGQLFGFANQLLGLFTGLGVVTLSVSSLVLWWRRRPEKVLGAPAALQRKPHRTTFLLIVVALAVYLPLLGISLIAVRLIEAFVLRRIPLTRNWLGLAGA
ncbi:MAG TPA: PepSY domain-containing protein, partial [Candidatus Acidoferrum sp.]|nr:PepSY domain-containing protein [Candidatus Acidoferrum sp.]